MIHEHQKLFYQATLQNWINNIVFTPRWWIVLGLLVVPWIVWYSLVHKNRIVEMLVYGLFMSGIILLIDEMGSELTLWTYPVKILPILPRLLTISSSFAPIIFILLYQYFPKWKSFIIANIITSAVITLIFQPLAVKLGFLIILNWNHVYSTLICIAAALISKLLIELVNNLENKAA